MRVIDMHCDTLMKAYLDKQDDIYKMPGMLDLERMKQGITMAQFFAIYLISPDTWEHYPNADRENFTNTSYIQKCVEIFHHNLEAHSDILAFAGNADDIERNTRAGKMSSILTVEDGAEVNGRMERLREYYDFGVRALNLTWNFKNCFGSPNSRNQDIMSQGLTEFGKEAVQYMQELGMLVDVSHLSDGGFWDVVHICKKPFIASHSNCRSLSAHPRNMTDDMIRALAEHGGVMGINFCPHFLNEDTEHDEHSGVEQMVMMAKHEKQVGGIEVIGIGSDLDGINGDLEIDSVSKMELLIDGLAKAGFHESEIDKICSGNILRVMKEQNSFK